MFSVFSDTFLFILTIGGLALPFMRIMTRYDLLDRLCLGLAAALVTIYIFTTSVYLSGVDSRWHWLLPLTGLGCAALTRQEIYATLSCSAIREIFTGWIILTAWCLILTALITSYAGGGWAGDWYEHYERTVFFLKHWPSDYLFIAYYPLPARPPLANLITCGLLALGRPDYARFQVISCLLSTLIYFPIQNVCRMLGGRKLSAALLLPALMLNAFFIQNATFPWTKLTAAFFILTSVPTLIRSMADPADRWLLPLAVMGLTAASLAHYSGVVWLIAFGVGWLFSECRRGRISRLREQLLWVTLPPVLLLTTWFGWAVARYGVSSTFGSNTTVQGAKLATFGDSLMNFSQNFLHTIVPHFLLGSSEPWMLQSNFAATVCDWFFHLYQETLPFTLGAAGMVLVVGRLICPRPSITGTQNRALWWTVLSLALLLGVATVATPGVWGLAHISLQPMVLLGLAWLIANLPETWPSLPNWSRLMILSLAVMDLICGVIMHFIVQHNVAENVHQLSLPARMNYAGKLRLGQPFLADVLDFPTWVLMFPLLVLLGVACWRVNTVDKSD